MKTPLLASAIVLAALGGLTACTPATTPASRPSTSTSAKVASIPTIPTGTGIIRSTKLESCSTAAGEVVAKGTITVPKDAAKAPVVSVSWVNSENSAVLTRGITTVDSGKRGTPVEWTISAHLPAASDSVDCVLGAVIPK